MKVTTMMQESLIKEIAASLGMETVDHNTYIRKDNRTVHTFKLRVLPTNDAYRSRNPITGRAVGSHIPCWHGYRDFYETMFDLDPDAETVSGSMGMTPIIFRSKQEFDLAHAETQYIEMGSQVYPYMYIDKCDHRHNYR